MKPTAVSLPKTQRIVSIDLLRGAVMIIMALDHVRDYFHLPAHNYDPLDLSQTSTAIFLTRWITHFCAPVFVFLAGTSAFLISIRKTKKELNFFLFTRGIWLVLLEITLVSFGWTFNIAFTDVGLQTIWALGMGMIALSVLIYLPKRAILAIALLIIIGHNALDGIHVRGKDLEAFGWAVLHDPGAFRFGPFNVFLAYPILSWIGVMALGFCFGEVYTAYNEGVRKRILIKTGLVFILVFLVLRTFNLYGDPNPWSVQDSAIFSFLSFIDTTKYPPSLLYILMTIGPAILILAYTEKPLNNGGKFIAVFGRVPMFYYILHIYLIHLAAVIVAKIWGYSWGEILTNPFSDPIETFGYGLAGVYMVWILVVLLLYPLCKSYDRYKLNNKQKWWLSYL